MQAIAQCQAGMLLKHGLRLTRLNSLQALQAHRAGYLLQCGKTPTCLYMAMQYGIRAANYPLTEDDMERLQLPESLKKYRDKLFGLTIDPDRLTAIRACWIWLRASLTSTECLHDTARFNRPFPRFGC